MYTPTVDQWSQVYLNQTGYGVHTFQNKSLKKSVEKKKRFLSVYATASFTAQCWNEMNLDGL